MEKLRDLRDTMPRLWSLVFYYHHVTYRTLCHASGHLVILPRVLRISESAFYSQAFFTLHSFLLVSRPPWGWQFNLKVSRASCWFSNHSHGPAICFNHNNPQKELYWWVYLRLMVGWSREQSAPHRFEPFWRQVKHVKSLMLYPFSHRATQSATSFLVFITLKLLSKILAGTYDFASLCW